MALASLALIADLPDVWQGDMNAQRALDVASAAIRDAAGAVISQQTSTVQVPGGNSNILPLPGPIRSVASVSIDGSAVAAADYEVLPNGLWRYCGWGRFPVPVTVTYTHGLTVVPVDIVAYACDLAVAWLAHQAEGGGSTAGLTSVRLDDAAETYSDEAAGRVSPVFIPQDDRQWLARRFGGGVEVVSTL